MALWSSAFIAIKIALIEITPFVLIFSRLMLGSIFFIIFWKAGTKVKIRDRWYLLLMSLFEPCLYFLLETMALQYTTASQAGVVFAFLPILIFAFSYLVYKEKPNAAQCIGGVVATLGVVILCLYGSPSEAGSSPVLGNFLELLAMACAAIYTILLKRLTGLYSPFFLAAVQSFTGAIFFLPFAVYEIGHGVTISAQSALAVLYLGVIVTAGAYTLFNIGISRVSVNQGALYFNLVPVFTLMFSIMLLHERVGYYQIVSMILVICGVAIGLTEIRVRVTEKEVGFRRKRRI